jgi:hypothetical protein
VQFKQSLAVANALLRIERRYHDPPRSNEIYAVEGLRGGAAILMVASFEVYLRELSYEVVDTLRRAGKPVTFSKLPPQMQEYTVYQTLSIAMRGPRYGPSTQRIDRLPDIRRAAQLILSDIVDPSAFGDTSGNPDAERLKEICKHLGMTDVFKQIRPTFDTRWKSSTHSTFIGDTLNAIVQRRHVVAHTAAALNISRADLREGLRFLRILAEVLDVHFRSHLRQVRRNAV